MMSSNKISISLTRYREPNWLVWETLDSLARQEGVQAEVLFLDQMIDKETEDYIRNLSTDHIRFEYIHIAERGLSYARNVGIRTAKNDIVLFIDSDAIAYPDWARSLGEVLSQPGVAAAGGKIVPKWHRRPLFLARSKVVVSLYSVLNLGDGQLEVSRVVGANMGLNKLAAGYEARFLDEFARQNGRLISGDDSDFCHRVRTTGKKVIYSGAAVVQHQILPERIRYSWVIKRLYYGGIARAMQGGAPDPTHKMEFWDYLALPLILPAYGVGYLRGRYLAGEKD